MQDIATDRQVISDGVSAKGAFGISLKDSAHLMAILRDNIYSDKVLAVLREYSANAWDSHRMSGKPDLPIKVVLPTALAPTLVIRDYGTGLSEEDVFQVYTQYGDSTKRSDDSAVGYLGIGSKSGFAYNDSFTVTSWHKGFKKVYVAVLDKSDKGEMQKLHEEPCGEETGIEIQIPVRPSDVAEFHRKAKSLFVYFEPRPNINIQLPTTQRDIKQHGYFTTEEPGWVGVMGCIPYRLNIEQVKAELEEAGLWEPLRRCHGGLFFDMREVQFSASREELRYTDYTKKSIVKKFGLMIEAYIENVLETLRRQDLSDWEKRLKAVYMVSSLKINLPAKYKSWADSDVRLWKRNPNATTELDENGKIKLPSPKHYTLVSEKDAVDRIGVWSDTRILIRDDNRALGGFKLKGRDYVARIIGNSTVEQVRAELEADLKDAKLGGLPIGLLSSLSWEIPKKNTVYGRTPNKKHQVRAFKLKESTSCGHPLSDNWEIESWEPSGEDVFVVLSSFKVYDKDDFYRIVREDRSVAKKLGLTFPPIYGYKNTAVKPVREEDCKGIPYFTWRKKFFGPAMTKERQALAQQMKWASVFLDDYKYDPMQNARHKLTALLSKELGEEHAITRLFLCQQAGEQAIRNIPRDEMDIFKHLLPIFGKKMRFDSHEALATVYKTYPMIRALGGIHTLNNSNMVNEWLDYVRLVDRDNERQAQEGLLQAQAA